MNNKIIIILKILNDFDLIGIAKYNDSGMEYLKEAKEIFNSMETEKNLSVSNICSFVKEVFAKNFQTGVDEKGKKKIDYTFDIGTAEQHFEIAKNIYEKMFRELENDISK
jgi:hypothetical protein